MATCGRCGRYVCQDCSGDEEICSACIRQQFLALPFSGTRASVAKAFILGALAMDAASMLIGLWSLSASEESALRTSLEGLVGLGEFIVFLGAGISFLMWLHLSVRQVNALGHDIGVTPGWAVGWWFVPFANLTKPYHVVRRIAVSLGGEQLADSLSLSGWWGAWIVGNVLGQIEGRMALSSGLEGSTPSAAYVFGIGSSVASIIAALLCVRIVSTVQAQLNAQRNAL